MLASPIVKLPWLFKRQKGKSVCVLARFVSIAGTLCTTSSLLAGPADSDLANETGDDPTYPLGRIELLDRFTEAPGPGVLEGTTRTVKTNIPFIRIDAPWRLSPEWEFNFRVELPVVSTDPITQDNPNGRFVSGIGNVLTQTWIIREFDQRWAAAIGAQLIAPTSTNGVALDAWEQVTGVVVRTMLPEISPGSYFAPQVRYALDFGGVNGATTLRQVRIAPTFNVNLPYQLFFTFYPSPDIRLNYGTPVWGQTGRLFVPANFMVGYKPTEHTVISAEFGIPIIREFPAYSFKTQLRFGYLF